MSTNKTLSFDDWFNKLAGYVDEEVGDDISDDASDFIEDYEAGRSYRIVGDEYIGDNYPDEEYDEEDEDE